MNGSTQRDEPSPRERRESADSSEPPGARHGEQPHHASRRTPRTSPPDRVLPSEAAGSSFHLSGLVAEILERRDRGEGVSVHDLEERFPERSEEIEDVLSVIELVEHAGAVRAGRAVENAEAPMEIGDFDIVREIGRGGMGVVYEAVQKSVSRTVALKVLPGDRFRDESRIERFRREVQSLARLEHPNVVQVYAAGRDNGAHFFAMRLVRGCGLDEVLRALQESEPGKSAPPGSDADSSRGSRPKADVREVAAALFGPVRAMAPSRSVLEIVRQVADALEYCHSRGVIHRDVKPSNILVDAAGHVCLTDFGLAKEEGCEGVTRTGDVVGTLAYLAPEALRGWSDPRSDVYGLGVTLYEILTRRRAFEHSDTHVLLQQIAENDPPRPRVLNPEIPRDLETIVLHAIEKEPARRYATAGELARDLQAHLESRVISVRRRTALERTWLWCRRNRAVAAGLGLAALALVAITVGAVVFGLRERRIAEEQRSLATEKRSFSDYQAQKIRQLGVEQERIGAERDAAKADLFRSLIGQARALRIARQPGYRVEADALLRRALDLDAAKTDADLRAVRDEVVASLGDWIGFEPTVSLDVELPARRKDPEAPAPILERLAAKVSGELLHQVLEDGTIAFTDTDGGWISLWRAGRVVRTHDLRRFRVTGVRQLALSPDGRLLALACKGGVGLLILGTGALYVHGQFPGDVVEGVSFDPTGRYLAATLAGGAGAEVYDVLAMRPVVRLPAPSGTEKFEFCGEGRLLVAVHRERRPLGAWTVGETPERTVLGGHRAGVTSIAWRPSGGHFATCSEDGTVKVWDAESGRVAADLRCLSGTRRDVAFSPDGELLVAVGRAPKIQVWDAEDGRQLGQLECRAAIGDLRALAFDPGGKYLVAMGEEELVVIGVKRAPGGVLLDEALVTRTRALRDLAIAPTRTDIFVTHGEPSRLARLDLLDRGRLCPLGTDRSRVLDSLHFDASGRLLMARDTSSRVQVIDWQEAARGRRQGAGQRVVAAGLEDLVPTSNLEFVSGLAGDITPALFSLKDDREIVRLPPERNTISCQRLRGDGDLLVLGLANGNVILWRLSEVWRRLESFGWKEAPAARPPSRLAVRPAPDALVETALGALGDVQELEVVVAGSQGRTSHLFRPDEAVHFVANAPQGTPDGAVDELFWDFGDGETTVRRRAGAEHAYSRAGVYRVFVSSRTARGSSRVVVADDPAALGKEFRVLHSWDFEKGAEDSVGAHHARLHAGARVAGGALRLDGKDDCASIPVDRFFAERVSLSIEAWVSSGGETPRPGRRILHMSSGPSRYAFLAARPFFRLRYRAPPTKAASLYPVRSLDYASGEPQHVVVTVDGEQLSWRIYLNGQLEGTREGRPACCLGSTAWNWIGRSQGRDLFLPAAVHALRFYDGALSPEVIALLHLRGPDAPRFVGMANDVPGESPRIEGGESPVRAGSVLEFRVRGLHDGDAAREDERTGNHATTETGPRPEPERAWDFADGDTATGAVVRHTYSHPGLYDVLLKAAGPGRFRVARRLVRVVAEHNPEAVLAVNFAADEPRNLHLGSEVAGLAGRLGSSAWTNVRGAAGEASGLRAMLDGRTVETVARVAWSSADTGDAVRAQGFRNRAPASDDYRLMSGCLVGIGKTESGESKPIRIDLDGLSAVFGEHRYDLWVYVLGPDEGQTGDLVAGGIRVEHTTGSPFDGAYREGEDVIAFRGLSGDACKLVATPTARESGARVFVSAIEVSRSPEGERES